MFFIQSRLDAQLEGNEGWLGSLVFGPSGQTAVVEDTPNQNPMHGAVFVDPATSDDDHDSAVATQVTSPSPTFTGSTSSVPLQSTTWITSTISSPLSNSHSTLSLSFTEAAGQITKLIATSSTVEPSEATTIFDAKHRVSPSANSETSQAAATRTSSSQSASTHGLTAPTIGNAMTTDGGAASLIVGVASATTKTTTVSTTFIPTTASSSFTPSSSSSHLATSSKNAQKYAGIALGSIAGVAILFALVAWAVRMRSRKRSDWTQWSWSPFGPTRDEDEGTAGFMWGRTTALNTAKPVSIDEATEGPPGISFGRPSANPFGSSVVAGGSCARQDLVVLDTASPLDNPFVDPAYVSTRQDVTNWSKVTEEKPNRSSTLSNSTSVLSLRPPKAEYLGPLQVTNLMPGDRNSSSGEETSPQLPNGFGTPRESGAHHLPRYLGVTGGGLDVSDKALPQPFSMGRASAPLANPVQHENNDAFAPGTASWAASIKNNLTSALAAVANRKFLTLPASGTTTEDRLTPLPVRGSIRRRRVYDVERQEPPVSLDKSATTGKYEEKSGRTGKGGETIYVAPGLACIDVDGVNLVDSPSSETESGVYSGGCGDRKEALQSPSGTPFPRELSIASDSSGEEKAKEGAARALESIREQVATRAGRPQLLVRTSSLLSCVSSDTDEERLTDDEKRARRMLLERRKRNMASPVSAPAAGKGRGLSSLRCSTKSVRRAGTSIKSKAHI